jgi:hypothetical protein
VYTTSGIDFGIDFGIGTSIYLSDRLSNRPNYSKVYSEIDLGIGQLFLTLFEIEPRTDLGIALFSIRIQNLNLL